MAIKEFYNWAVENHVEDYDIAIQYRDGGGYYSGRDSNIYCTLDDIDERAKEVVL